MIKSIDDDKMDQILSFFHLEHDDDLLYFYLHVLQDWLVVAPSSTFLQYQLHCFINTEESMLEL